MYTDEVGSAPKKLKKISQLDGHMLEKSIIELRKLGFTVQSIVAMKNEGESDEHKCMQNARIIEHICKSFNSHDLTELVINSDVCQIIDTSECYIYDPTTRKRNPISENILPNLFAREYLYKKKKLLYSTYEPRNSETYIEKEGTVLFNRYRPAKWNEKFFFNEAKPQQVPIPEIYREFFMHLVAGDTESYDYLLKWLAKSIQGRNHCYLVTVGTQGVGKGLLYQIVEALHGIHNSAAVIGKAFFEDRFGDTILDKTFLYINEVNKISDSEFNQLKDMESAAIRIEPKGKPAKMVDNHINLMISSNDIAALPIPKNERRLSIITLTKTPTIEFWKDLHQDKVNELQDPKNIAQLGEFLLSSVTYTDSEIIKKFTSASQIREIKKMQLEDWQDYFLFEYCKVREGETVSVSQIASEVRQKMDNNKIRLSLRVFKQLKEQFPGFFVIRATKRDDGSSGAIGLGFMPIDQQPSREHFQLEIIDGE